MTLLGLPFNTFKDIYFFTNPSLYFLSLLALFMVHFHSKIACFCIYSNFKHHDNLLLFLPPLKTHLKPFLKFQPSPFIVTPPFIKFQTFFRPPCLFGPPRLSGTREYENCIRFNVFFICKYLKYKQQYRRTVRTQKRFTTLQGRYHGVQDVVKTPQPLTFRTHNYTKVKYATTITIQKLITKNN